MVQIKRIIAVLTAAAAVTALAACKKEPPRVSVEKAEVQFSGAMKDEAMVFLSIVNKGGADTLVSVRPEIPGAVATIHEMRGGIMVIAKSLPIPEKMNVNLEPTTSHIMIENLPKDVKPGYRFTLTLGFERSGEIRVPLEFTKPGPAQTEQPMNMDMQMHHH